MRVDEGYGGAVVACGWGMGRRLSRDMLAGGMGWLRYDMSARGVGFWAFACVLGCFYETRAA